MKPKSARTAKSFLDSCVIHNEELVSEEAASYPDSHFEDVVMEVYLGKVLIADYLVETIEDLSSRLSNPAVKEVLRLLADYIAVSDWRPRGPAYAGIGSKPSTTLTRSARSTWSPA